MKTISEYIGQEIMFAQPSVWKRTYELKANEETIGTLEQKGFFCGMKWIAAIQNKTWEIYKPSFWKASLDIREAGYEMPIANFIRDSFRSKGTLNLPKGERIKIEPHLFKGYCEIKNEQDESLVQIKLKSSMKEKAFVSIVKKSDVFDKYPWIIMLAYLIALEQKQQAQHAAH
jgi:hypothetical protein